MANTNEKILKTRIKLRYDTLANWTNTNPYLLEGEVAVTVVTTKKLDEKTGNVVDVPATLFKVGAIKSDQQTDSAQRYYHFNELPWASGMAADVYEWAKGSNPLQSITDDQGNSLETILNDIDNSIATVDTNTTYQIVAGTSKKVGMYQLQKQEKGSAVWSNVGGEFGIDEEAITNRLTSLETVVQWDKTNLTLGTDNVGQILLSDGSSRPVYVPANGEQGSEEDLAFLSDIPSIPSGSGSVTPTDNITVVDSVSLSGHTLSGSTKKFVGSRGIGITGTSDQITIQGPDLSGYATKSELSTKVSDLEKLINPGMEFKGVLSITALTGLPTAGVKQGDTYKLGKAFSTYKIGDAIIAIKNDPKQIIDDTTNWALIPAGDDIEDTWREIQLNDTSIGKNKLNLKGGDKVTVVSSTTGGVTTATINHNKIDAPTSKGTDNTRTYLTSIETDTFGHITGYKTHTETVIDHDTKNTIGSDTAKNSGSSTKVSYALPGLLSANVDNAEHYAINKILPRTFIDLEGTEDLRFRLNGISVASAYRTDQGTLALSIGDLDNALGFWSSKRPVLNGADPIAIKADLYNYLTFHSDAGKDQDKLVLKGTQEQFIVLDGGAAGTW